MALAAPTEKDFRRYLDFAKAIAIAGGDFLLNYGEVNETGRDFHIPTNYKTIADVENDKRIRGSIELEYPDHGIWSEEHPPKKAKSRWRWVVDSFDGTLPGTSGVNTLWAVNIALCFESRPVIGVTHAPRYEGGTTFWAARGMGAFMNETPITVSPLTNFNQALVGMDPGKAPGRERMVQMEMGVVGPDGVTCVFQHGCASVPLALVAAGKLHIYTAPNLEFCDIAPGIIIAKEAGARVTTLGGRQHWFNSFEKWKKPGDHRSILVANPGLHREFRQRVAGLKWVGKK